MKHFSLLLISALIFSLSSCASEPAEYSFDFGKIHGIQASSIHHITVEKGKSTKIKVVCPKKLAQHLDYSAKDGILYLHLNDGIRDFSERDNQIRVSLQVEDLSSISLSAAAEAVLNGDFNCDNVKINLTGASELDGRMFITGKDLDLTVSGASECDIKGKFNDVKATVSGASDFNLKADVNSLNANASGASEFDYSGNCTGLTIINCSGASEVELSGSTGSLKSYSSGAGEVKSRKFRVQNRE